jgi:hypothetical protein
MPSAPAAASTAVGASPRRGLTRSGDEQSRESGRAGPGSGPAPPDGQHRRCAGVQESLQLGRQRAFVRPTSGTREDDELLGRSGHRDIAVDRSFDAVAERLRVDEDDQVELEPLR